MGFFTGLIMLPLAPARGVIWVGQQIEEEVDRRLNDPGVIRAKIDELDAQFERGEISEDDRDEQQETLLARLMGREQDGPA